MRVGITLLALWTVVNIVLTVRVASSGDTSPAQTTSSALEVSADSRTPVILPLKARDAVLAEMRMMLGSVQGVLDGVARSDTAAVRAAAAASGLVMAADPALAQVLPPAFMQFGMAAHQAFDSLAANASRTPAATVERLARITSTCVACHAMYRLELR